MLEKKTDLTLYYVIGRHRTEIKPNRSSWRSHQMEV